MTYDPRNVVSSGFPLDDFTFTYKLSGTVAQANVGNAVTLDTSAASTMKLAADGDEIHGRLTSVEDRTLQGAGTTGAVQRKFKEKLPAAVGHGIVVGDSVCGSATAGSVRKAVLDVDATSGAAKVATSDPITNLVVEVGTDFVVVESL
jgi:hypothetical protein